MLKASAALMPGVTAARQSFAEETSDQSLLRLIGKHDGPAMRVLFRRYKVRVFRFLMQIVGNRATAEDLASEVFVEVWRCAARFEARSHVVTWILGIARHKALAALRRRSFEELKDDVADSIEDPADDPELAVQKNECNAILRQCIERLSRVHREVIDLAYYHELSINDIAQIIGVPQNTVKTRMFHARKRIAELMAARGVERER
jgi:RNA polymerase sigma-70 factor (ECF subfamily)